MLYMWGFDRVAAVAGDLFFVDPDPGPGQEGAEHGVRLEVRLLARPPLTGSIYAAQPIVIDKPVWRADLLESIDGVPGSHDRTHHHPRVRGWEPGTRQFEPEMTADPLGWVGRKLADLPALLEAAELEPGLAGPDDARRMAEATPEITSTIGLLLERVRSGELARPNEAVAVGATGARVGWL